MMQDGYPGFKNVTDGLSRLNVVSFIVKQALAGIATAQLVQVKAVVSPTVVNVQPMVNQVGGDGARVPHGVIFNVPVMRLGGGGNAIIATPAVNDIGLAVFAMRDISSVKANKAVSNPGSNRILDYADALYVGGFLNADPQQFVQFTDDGINITDKNGNTVVMDSTGITMNGVKIDQSGNVSGVIDLTTTGTAHLGGGAQFIKLADGSNSTTVKAT